MWNVERGKIRREEKEVANTDVLGKEDGSQFQRLQKWVGEPCQQTDCNELCLGQLKLSWALIGAVCTAKTQHRKFETNIPRKVMARA